MRRRIGCASSLGIGRSIGTTFCLDNNFEGLSKKQIETLVRIEKDFCETFEKFEYCEFGFSCDRRILYFGVEPSYMYDKLLVFGFNFDNREESTVQYGTSFGPYGSNIAIKRKALKDYKRESVFTRFIEKWYNRVIITLV